ncbi:hypothetical protein BH23THE1_BH23THE1_31360 [soil metagenome]
MGILQNALDFTVTSNTTWLAAAEGNVTCVKDNSRYGALVRYIGIELILYQLFIKTEKIFDTIIWLITVQKL